MPRPHPRANCTGRSSSQEDGERRLCSDEIGRHGDGDLYVGVEPGVWFDVLYKFGGKEIAEPVEARDSGRILTMSAA